MALLLGLTTVKLIAILVSLVFFIGILRLVIKKKLSEGDSILWLGFSVLVIILAVFENVLGYILDLTQTKSPEMTLLFFSTVFILLLVLKNALTGSKQREQIKILTQELALVKADKNEVIRGPKKGKTAK